MNAGALRLARIAVVALAGLAAVAFALAVLFAGERVPPPPLVVDAADTLDNDLIVMGQSVEIVGNVKGGVLVFGGDVTLGGVVGGDVATVGGSLNQTGGHVGGDILVVGGQYTHDDSATACRVDGSVNVSGYNQWLRDFFNDPARELLAPTIDRAYVGRRIAQALFSFLLALGIVAAAPGPVGRASERLVTDPLRVAAIGLVGTAAVLLLAGLLLVLLPAAFAALALGPLLLVMLAAQVFGRVVAYFFVGRMLQRRFLGETSRSQTVALSLGVLTLAFLGSLPVVGALLLFAVFIVSMGLTLTSPRLAARA